MVEDAVGPCPTQMNLILAGSSGFLAAACICALLSIPFPPVLPAHIQTLSHIAHVQDHFLSSLQVTQVLSSL